MTNVTQNIKFDFHRAENIVGKGANACYQQFLAFPTMFTKGFFLRASKVITLHGDKMWSVASMYYQYLLDAIEVTNLSNILRKLVRGWPLKVLNDWNDIALALQGCHNFLVKGKIS